MTNVIVNAIDVLGQEIDEGVVKISAADIQYTGGTLMLPEYHEQELVSGSTTITGVTPGKVVISIHWGVNRTATFRVFVPDTTEITLAELTLQKYDTDPAVVSQVADAALRAEDAAAQAEGVADAFGSLEGIQAAVDGAASSAAAAAGSATAAGDAAARAETAAENAQVGIAPDSVLRTMLEPAIRLELDGLRTDVDGVSSSWSDITDKPAMFPPEGHDHPAVEISDSSVVGRSVLTAADAAAARGAIGAGTSSLGLGSTSGTAAPGNHTHSQYATTTQVEARTPEIRIVSSPDMATSPGVLYVVRED